MLGASFFGKKIGSLLPAAALMAGAAYGLIAPERALAQSEDTREFDIEAQPLQDAIVLFSRQSGVQITAQGGLTAGRNAAAVKGRLSVAQALSSLLSGSGLTWRRIDNRTIVLEPAPQASGDAVQLGPVRVAGEGSAIGNDMSIGGQSARDAEIGFAGYAPRTSSSAMKGSASLIETPQAVSSVGAQQISDQAARTVMEAMRYSPGIRAESTGNDVRSDWFRMRGFISQVNSYFLDGLQLQLSNTFASWKVNPYLLERIDILRGPSSAMYGSGNPGGLVNMISKRPGFRTAGEAAVSIDEYGNARVGLDAQGANASGSLAWRVVATGNAGKTEVDHIRNNQFAVMPTVTFKPGDETAITAYASFSKSRTRGQNFLPYEGTVTAAPFGRISRDLFVSEPDLDTFKRTQAMVGYEAEHRFDETISFRQNLRYAHLELDIYGLAGTGYVGPSANATLARGNSVSLPKLGLFTVDNQLELKFATGAISHTLLFGADYKRFDLNDESGFGAATSLNLLNPVYSNPGKVQTRYDDADTVQRQIGFYIQDHIRIDRLNIVLSGRYDDVKTRRDDNLTNLTTRYSSHAFSGRAGAIYTFDNGFAPYATISRSFLPLTGVDALTGREFKPETALQYEAGIKFAPPSLGGTIFTASWFDLTRKNFTTSDGRVFNRQIGEARSRGFELEAVGQITPELKGVASYTKYDFKIKNGNPVEIGKIITATPEEFGGIWLDYTKLSGPLQGFSAGAGIRYVGSSYADNINTLKVPGVTLFDAALRYDLGDFGLALNVANLTDKRYVASCSNVNTCFYGAGRRATLTASYNW